eukprot:3784311-Amphidinium_carterae.1
MRPTSQLRNVASTDVLQARSIIHRPLKIKTPAAIPHNCCKSNCLCSETTSNGHIYGSCMTSSISTPESNRSQWTTTTSSLPFRFATKALTSAKLQLGLHVEHCVALLASAQH